MKKTIIINILLAVIYQSAFSNEKAFIDLNKSPIQNAKQMTFVGPKSGEGYFSKDGQKMIFQSEREPGNPFYQMYIFDFKTQKTQRLSPGYGKTTCGWIHPNLKTVLWSSTHEDKDWKKKQDEEIETRRKAIKAKYSWSFDENYDIYTSDLNGKNIKRLTKEKGYDAEGSFSPDGKWIAFASNRAGYTEKLSEEDQKLFNQDQSYMMDIYIMKSDGTSVKRLTTAKGYDGGPFFSADGKKITWRRFAPNGATAEIYTMNVDGSDQKQITHMNAMSWAPFFHPSGDYIIFTTSILGYSNFELFIVDTAGKHLPVRVSNIEGFDGLPTFSPDGTKISWTHRNEKGDSQIFIADWDDAMARNMLGLAPHLSKQELSPEVRQSDVKSIINYLASEYFGGRRTGSDEEKIYTQKIVELFKAWGLKPGGPNKEFIHDFEFISSVQLGENNELEFVGAQNKKLKAQEEFLPLSFSKLGKQVAAPIVFVGYGIKAPATDKLPEYNSYKNADVKGKWALVFKDIPNDVSPERRQQLNMYARLQHKLVVAKNEGAIGVIFISGPIGVSKDRLNHLKLDGGNNSESGIFAIAAKTETVTEIAKSLGIDLKELQKKNDAGEILDPITLPSLYLQAQVDLKFMKSKGFNVIGKLDLGAKKSIMIGAHGDHLGHGEVGSSLAKADEETKAHVGADDNASGVSGVLELANYFSKNKNKLKQNLYFSIWSGEEIGILGSTHFVDDYGKDKIKKDFSEYINLDMVGRLRDKLYVQGIASGLEWPLYIEKVAFTSPLAVVTQEDPYLPTDSMALYLAEIPSISFFTGSHAEYHTPRDVPELINYKGIVDITNFIRNLVINTTDTVESKIAYQKVKSENKNLEGRSFRVYLGTLPDYTKEGVKGVAISGVSKDSPAEKAGLKDKDIIVEFGKTKIDNIYDYVYTLQSIKPNQETTIKVKRDQALLEFKITPLLKE